MGLEVRLDVELCPEAISEPSSESSSDIDQQRWNIEEDLAISYSTYLNKYFDRSFYKLKA
jgi:hypothetical protein